MTTFIPGQTRLPNCTTHCTCPTFLIERDRWGRPVVDGVPRTRVSTLASTLDDSYGLVAWKARQVLLGATQTTLRQAASAGRLNPKRLDELAEDAARRAGSNDAADEGTLMHELLSGYALDPDSCNWDDLDDQQAETVTAFGTALRGAGLTAVFAEQFVVGETFAGTYDLALRDRDGRMWLADVKTSARMWDRRKPLKVATQLAAYAAGRHYCPTLGVLPTPEWDGLLLISAPLNAGDIYLDVIDTDEARRALSMALDVRAVRAASARWTAPLES